MEAQARLRIPESQGAIAFISLRPMVIFGVDQKSHAIPLLRDRHAAFGGAQKRPPAQSASLHAAIDRKTAKSIDRDLIRSQTTDNGL